MRKHWNYFTYVARHKYYVFVAGMSIGAPLWNLIIHDWSKFLPREWTAYVNYFQGEKTSATKEQFDIAWNYHQKTNPHHWQYWVLITDSDTPRVKALRIPEQYVYEMVADWMGAGRAITGKWEVSTWYENNKDKYVLEDSTRILVEDLIELAKIVGKG